MLGNAAKSARLQYLFLTVLLIRFGFHDDTIGVSFRTIASSKETMIGVVRAVLKASYFFRIRLQARFVVGVKGELGGNFWQKTGTQRLATDAPTR